MNDQPDDSDPEITRKRKNTTTTTTTTTTTQEYQLSHDQEEQENDLLALSLSIRPPSRPRREIPVDESSHPLQHSHHPPPSSPLPPQPCSMQTRLVSPTPSPPQLPLQISPSQHSIYIPQPFMLDIPTPAAPPPPASRRLRARRNPTQAPGEGKGDTVPALYPWSTTQRATVHSLSYLVSKHITTIKGEVQCKKCEKQFEIEYQLRDKFYEVYRFVVENRSTMHDRAPAVWMNPVLPACKFCDQENSAKPVIPDKKKEINWLFLLLGSLDDL